MRLHERSCVVCIIIVFFLGTEINCVENVCFPGSFLASNGTCSLCPAGSYSMQAGAKTCFACMLGSFASKAGMSQCVFSSMGEYVPRVGQSSSVLCPVGTFQYVGGSSSCLICGAGSFQNYSGATACDTCFPGTFQSSVSLPASSCDYCSVGSYSSAWGSTACISCSVGTFQSSVNSTFCSACPVGEVQAKAGGASCVPCIPGTFQANIGSTSCTLCQSGTYLDSYGANECIACPVGTFHENTGGVSLQACEACSEGKYVSMAGSSSCLACAVGAFSSSIGSTGCKDCLVGTFQLNSGSSTCMQCKAGSYGDPRGNRSQVACLLCDPGTYSTAIGAQHAGACSSCPFGYFSNTTGADSMDFCNPCPAGSIALQNHSSCLSCENGTFCPEGSAMPIVCRDQRLDCNGTHLMGKTGFLPIFFDFEGCVGAIPCPRGTVCHQGPTVYSGDLAFTGTNVSRSQSDPVFFVVFTPGPYYEDVFDCDSTDNFSYGYSRMSPGIDQSLESMPLYWVQALDCPAGTFLYGEDCVPCSRGFFLDRAGAVSEDSCVACSTGTFASLHGSSACVSCPAGTYQPNTSGTVCIACAPGTFLATLAASSCYACPPGSFQAELGKTACDLCEPGTSQSSAAAINCSTCAPDQFSSVGDTGCTTCGVTPSSKHVCPVQSTRLSNLQSFFLSVRGEREDDMCLGIGLDRFLPGPRSGLQLSIHPLWHSNVRCLHSLSVMGRPEMKRVWTTAHRLPRKPAILRVLPHGAFVNLALCARDGLTVSFVMQDEHGGYETVLAGAEATLALVSPEGTALLFWTHCEHLPRQVMNDSAILVGTCVARDFCPTMDVIARVTVSWSGGLSVQGEHVLKMERESLCPPQTSWMGLVEIENPGMRFFPGDKVRARVQIVNLPRGIVSFSFKLHIFDGFEFESFQSDMSTTYKFDNDGILSVEGDSTGSSLSVLGAVIFRVKGAKAGVVRALRLIPHSFQVTLDDGSKLVLQVNGQGFVCKGDGEVLVLVYHRSIFALVASPRSPTLIDWQALQPTAMQSRLQIYAIGVWNVPGLFSLVQEIQCRALTRGVINVKTCAAIRVVSGRSGGVVRIRVTCSSASTVLEHPVLVPWVSSVVSIPGLDGMSGRFKVLARFRFGKILDYFGVDMDVTPYILDLPASGVTLLGEEWVCPASSSDAALFSLGMPVLLRGTCRPVAQDRFTGVLVASFLFTGGVSGVGRFTFSQEVLHPSTPTGTLLILDASTGLLMPSNAYDAAELDGDRFEKRFLVEDGMKLTLTRVGMSPVCVPLPAGNTLPVLPASPLSLRVILSKQSLVTQHDIWGLMPSSATVLEASLLLSDNTVLDVRQDSRLFWTSVDDLEIIDSGEVRSRNTAGNFTVNYGMRGIACVGAAVSVQVYPYSTTSAVLVCDKCPDFLTSRDDPLTIQFPDRFPSFILENAFTIRHLLVDGSVVERPCEVEVQGAGVLEDGKLHGTGAGAMLVKTDSARGVLEIQVIDKYVSACCMLCNGLACDSPDLRLTIPGDGAEMSPFSYDSSLVVTVNLTLFGHSSEEFPLLDGMHLRVNGSKVSFSRIQLQVRGRMDLELIVAENYGLSGLNASIQIHGLQSLVISGPPVLFQIHCSRAWEQALFNVVATLTDGIAHSLRLEKNVVSDGQILIVNKDLNTVWATGPGQGWLRASLGDVSAVYSVLATHSSKYYDSIRISPPLPSIWNAREDQELPLNVLLKPEYNVLYPDMIQSTVLRWSSSVPGVVQFKQNSTRLGLLSDYHSNLSISCVLLACMAQDLVVMQHEMSVNLIPSISGQIDLGRAEGVSIPPVAVGNILSIPVFLYTEKRLREYFVQIMLDHVSLLPLGCTGGEIFQSKCLLSDQNDLFEVSANFSSSQRSGRILVAEVQGRVTLDTVSQIHVLVKQIVIGDDEQMLGPIAYRFSVRVGADRISTRFSQPYLNQRGPLRPPTLAISTFIGEEDPNELVVCCDQVVAAKDSRLVQFFPSDFLISMAYLTPSGVNLSVTDPRVQLRYDDSLLEFLPEIGLFQLKSGVSWHTGKTQVTVVYTCPWTFSVLYGHVEVKLAEIAELRLTPTILEIRRIHCSGHAFRNGSMRGELVLTQELGVLPLAKHDGLIFSVKDASKVLLSELSLTGDAVFQGVSPGVSNVYLDAFGLQAQGKVLVLQESDCFSGYDLHDPIIIVACQGQTVPIPILGRLWDGTQLAHLDRLFPVVLNVVSSAVHAHAGNLSLTVMANTQLDGSGLNHVSLHMPACEGAPETTVQAMLRTRIMACIDPFHQVADVEVGLSVGGEMVLRLVGKGILAFYIHFRTDIPESSFTCQLLSIGDCVMGSNSTVIIAGFFAEPVDLMDVAIIRPVVKQLWGFVEVFSGVSPYRVPIVAGRHGMGAQSAPVKILMPSLPVVDTATLSHSVTVGNERFVLDLMTNRQRLVDFRFYSHEQELSIMFRVTDRFLDPDSHQAQIHVMLPPSDLPVLPGADSRPDGGQVVPASYVMDGWYAVQWQGAVPSLTLDLEYHVTTTTSISPKVWKASNLVLGKPFRQCPRVAAQVASFVLTHRVFLRHLNLPWLTSHLVCAVHVPARRIQFSGFNDTSGGWGEISMSLESFIRVQQAREIFMSPWFAELLNSTPAQASSVSYFRRQAWKRHSLEMPEHLVLEARKLSYINDTQDGVVACPHGMYFSLNGTYTHLPMHSVAGEDCYGMKCVTGYRFLGEACVPVEVSADVTWICVTIVLTSVAVILCLICCVRMARSSHASDPLAKEMNVAERPPTTAVMPVVMNHDGVCDLDMLDRFEDIFPEHEWAPYGVTNIQLQDYATQHYHDHSLHSPLPHGAPSRCL